MQIWGATANPADRSYNVTLMNHGSHRAERLFIEMRIYRQNGTGREPVLHHNRIPVAPAVIDDKSVRHGMNRQPLKVISMACKIPVFTIAEYGFIRRIQEAAIPGGSRAGVNMPVPVKGCYDMPGIVAPVFIENDAGIVRIGRR